MTFLAPWALWVAGAVAAAVVALHFLASANPRRMMLPTTRFIPERAASATARAIRFSELPWLLLRVAIVMLAGLAFARPVLSGARRPVGRVVMVDHSRLIDRHEAADSAAKYYARGDRLFVFDSAAYELRKRFPVADVAAERMTTAPPRGSISTALAAGMRAASALRGEADSVELVLISPFAAEEFDAATSAIRAAWPGRVRLVHLGAPRAGQEQEYHEVRNATLDDPIRAIVALSSQLDTGEIKTDSIRIDRGSLASVDTTWTQYGLALVRWPAALDSSGFKSRAHADSAGAVMVTEGNRNVVVVSPFVRTVSPPPGRVLARWADGTPAATERKMMNGCVRDVAIPLPRAGDLALRESTRRLVAALAGPCEQNSDMALASDSTVASLAGTGALVATRALAARTAPPGALTIVLLAAALALLLLEPLLRRAKASV
jgi:hypothetical protein